MKAFRRWLTKPVVSIADALLAAASTSAADILKLAWNWRSAALMSITCVTTACSCPG